MAKVLLGAVVESISTRADNSFKITIGTQEIDKYKVADLFSLCNKYSKILISDDNITSLEEGLVVAEKIAGSKKEKSAGQRLRNVLYVYSQQQGIEEKDFEQFYKDRMEMLINQIKERLEKE